jgi:hypothetical protein
VFYAQSWALTHMLLMGEPRRSEELKAYLRLTSEGLDETAAWKKAFGAAQVEHELHQYLSRFSMRAYKFDLPKTAQFKGAAMMLPEADAQAILAGLHIRQQRRDDAETLLRPVLKTQPNHAFAGTIMGHLEVDRGEHAAAAKRLLALDASDDWFVRYLAGIALSDVVTHDEAHTAAAAAAMRHFEAVGGRREVPHALARIADLELVPRDGPVQKARASIERARTLAPGRDDYTFTYARVLAQAGEFAAARAALAPLLHPTNTEGARTSARSLMAYLVNLESYRKRLAEHPTATGRPAAPPTSGSGRPPSGLIAIYRQTRPGEERIEGILERIECPPKSGPLFHIKTGNAPAVFKAAAFDKVEFITYRDDLTGSITCGAVKEPMWVYVTVGPGEQAGAKVVMAIEFLPK